MNGKNDDNDDDDDDDEDVGEWRLMVQVYYLWVGLCGCDVQWSGDSSCVAALPSAGPACKNNEWLLQARAPDVRGQTVGVVFIERERERAEKRSLRRTHN